MKKSDLQAVNPVISNITSNQLKRNYYLQPTPEEFFQKYKKVKIFIKLFQQSLLTSQII